MLSRVRHVGLIARDHCLPRPRRQLHRPPPGAPSLHLYRTAPPPVLSLVIFDGRQWTSSDGQWLWDGTAWRRTTPDFTVDRVPGPSVEAWIMRSVLIIQGSGIGCAGLMLAMIAFFAVLGGAFLAALAVFGAATVAVLLTAGFGWLALKQGGVRNRWRIVLL